MGFQGSLRGFCFSLAVAITVGGSACSKWKREDAGEATTGSGLAQSTRALTQLARAEPASNFVRSSGEVVFLRLSALFPRAVQTSASSRAFMTASAFESLTADGINRAIADEGRPTSSLAQVALRKWVAPLCKNYLDAPSLSLAAGSVFSEASALVRDETLSAVGAARESLVAARNIWLDVFPANAPEVQALADLYAKTLARSGGTPALARQAVCMAALLSPQFLIGNLGPRDVIRRVSLELGRTIPSLQDMRDYELGQLSLDTYLRQVQEKPSYLLALRSWHRDWWGLREFRTKLSGVAETDSDPRAGGGDLMNFSELGSVAMVPRETMSDGRARVEPTGRYRGSNPGGSAYQCVSKKADGSPNLQTFDPRTVLVVYEHFHTSASRWEIVAGYVHQDRLTDYQDLVRAYDSAFDATASCTLVPETDPKFRKDVPNYFRCKGSVSATAGGFIASQLEDYLAGPTQQQDTAGRGIDLFVYPSSYHLDTASEAAGKTPYQNGLVNSVHARFRAADRRIRRLAPTGWQDGISAVKTWWSGDTTYVCNSFERYRITCPFRVSNTGRSYESGYNKWYYVNQSVGITPRAEYAETGSYTSSFFNTSPLVLNQFRCGVPNVAEIPQPVPSLIPEALAYPRGYEVTSAAYLNPRPLAAGKINDLAILGGASGVVAPLEAAAVSRLQEDLRDEPYRLLEYVLKENRPYSEMVRARFTLGREELELAYRSHFLFLPTFPPGYLPPGPEDSRRGVVRQIPRAEFPAIPANWTKGPYNVLLSHYANSPRVKETGLIPAAPAAGILTMPAFLGPVSQKMRVISSRIFERLLCGTPNQFAPQGSQAQLHERYMSDPRNPAPATHMDGKSGCYSCHVNLDPLAAALSGPFLENVQKDETLAMQGQFLLVSSPTTGRTFLGGRGNSESGEGAFLGQPAQGFTAVGDILAESPLFYRCVTTRAFEKVMGRTPTMDDLKTFEQFASEFQTHRDFNRLIRRLVASSMYRREN